MIEIIKILLSGIVKRIPNIFGDRSNRERYQHESLAAAMEQFAAEFLVPRQTWYGRLIDALNRLPRPIIVAHVIASFWYLILWPEDFGLLMAKLALAPEWYAYLVLGVLLFWFGGRPFEKTFSAKFDRKKFEAGLEIIRKMEAEKRYREDMEDEDTPLSDESIKRWNDH